MFDSPMRRRCTLAVAFCCAVSGYAPSGAAMRPGVAVARRLVVAAPGGGRTSSTARFAEDEEKGGMMSGFSLPSFGKSEEEAAPVALVAKAPIIAGEAFTVDEFPMDTDEMVDAYRRWNAASSSMVTEDEARRDIQAFLATDGLMEKWRPILASAAAEANKKTFVDYVNDFTSIALPLAVGFTLLPILRQGAENVPILNDVVVPKLDSGLDALREGIKNLINLPICLEFGDC